MLTVDVGFILHCLLIDCDDDAAAVERHCLAQRYKEGPVMALVYGEILRRLPALRLAVENNN